MRTVRDSELCFKLNCKHMTTDDYVTLCDIANCTKSISTKEIKEVMGTDRDIYTRVNGKIRKVER